LKGYFFEGIDPSLRKVSKAVDRMALRVKAMETRHLTIQGHA
jgi:hypothetical protein